MKKEKGYKVTRPLPSRLLDISDLREQVRENKNPRPDVVEILDRRQRTARRTMEDFSRNPEGEGILPIARSAMLLAGIYKAAPIAAHFEYDPDLIVLQLVLEAPTDSHLQDLRRLTTESILISYREDLAYRTEAQAVVSNFNIRNWPREYKRAQSVPILIGAVPPSVRELHKEGIGFILASFSANVLISLGPGRKVVQPTSVHRSIRDAFNSGTILSAPNPAALDNLKKEYLCFVKIRPRS